MKISTIWFEDKIRNSIVVVLKIRMLRSFEVLNERKQEHNL